jgi:hypothetical protein
MLLSPPAVEKVLASYSLTVLAVLDLGRMPKISTTPGKPKRRCGS